MGFKKFKTVTFVTKHYMLQGEVYAKDKEGALKEADRMYKRGEVSQKCDFLTLIGEESASRLYEDIVVEGGACVR